MAFGPLNHDQRIALNRPTSPPVGLREWPVLCGRYVLSIYIHSDAIFGLA